VPKNPIRIRWNLQSVEKSHIWSPWSGGFLSSKVIATQEPWSKSLDYKYASFESVWKLGFGNLRDRAVAFFLFWQGTGTVSTSSQLRKRVLRKDLNDHDTDWYWISVKSWCDIKKHFIHLVSDLLQAWIEKLSCQHMLIKITKPLSGIIITEMAGLSD